MTSALRRVSRLDQAEGTLQLDLNRPAPTIRRIKVERRRLRLFCPAGIA
ncbi:hypothetical protein [Nocardia beijingensis]